jgi:1,4-dihydroxy-2-naphthoate octaprenyltransferase
MLLHVYLTLAFGLLALQNLLLFSLFEEEEDFRQGQRSMVIYLGHRSIKRLLMLLFCSFSILIFVAWQHCSHPFEKQVVIMLILMSAILLMLLAFPGYFVRYKRYRWLGDGVFLLPVWLLL